MTTYPRTMPDQPRMFTATVVRSHRHSPSFQRVTVAGPALADFTAVGLDQWFRLFLPTGPEQDLVLPEVEGRTWWQQYLDIPEKSRPHCSNYTVAGYRSAAESDAELDIDVVLHWDDAGELCGGVAVWADGAQPGQPLGLLDQGVLFDPPADTTELVLVADETGLPALRGIVAALPPDARGRVIVEVPTEGDIEDWPVPDGLDIVWISRSGRTERPGELALAELRSGSVPAATAYGFIVGESSLATGGRRWLVGQGLAKDRIFFSGFWKNDAA